MTTLYLEGATNDAGVVEHEKSFGDVTSIIFLGTLPSTYIKVVAMLTCSVCTSKRDPIQYDTDFFKLDQIILTHRH